MEALRAQGHDLPLNQARVFQRIAPGGSRLAELAEAAQLPKQTVGSIIDQLETAGYVQRSTDPEDARARLVTVTPRGSNWSRSASPSSATSRPPGALTSVRVEPASSRKP